MLFVFCAAVSSDFGLFTAVFPVLFFIAQLLK